MLLFHEEKILEWVDGGWRCCSYINLPNQLRPNGGPWVYIICMDGYRVVLFMSFTCTNKGHSMWWHLSTTSVTQCYNWNHPKGAFGNVLFFQIKSRALIWDSCVGARPYTIEWCHSWKTIYLHKPLRGKKLVVKCLWPQVHHIMSKSIWISSPWHSYISWLLV